MKRLLKGCALFAIILVVWIMANSIDISSYDDHGLLNIFHDIPDEENGFLDIAYIGDEDFYEKTGIDSEKIRDMANGKKWDPNYIQRLINDNQKLFSDIKKSIEKNGFKLPELRSELDPMFSYGHLFDVWRLLILKSRLEVQTFKVDEAIETLDLAILSAQKVRSEQRYYMISYFIGVAAHRFMFDWIHEMVTNYPLSNEQYAKIIQLMNEVDSYHQDEFKYVFSGEFAFGVAVLNNYRGKSFSDKIKDSIEGAEWRRDWYKWSDFDVMLYQGFELMRALIPAYYEHYNQTISDIAGVMKKMSEQSENYCNKVSLNWEGGVSWGAEFFWHDLLRPNSYGERQKPSQADWMPYFEKRCLHHVYMDSVRTAVAIHWFEKDNHRAPENLDELTPKYLKALPVDYFDGEQLRYSMDDRWLYSIGDDYQDDSGSLLGGFDGRCDEYDESKNVQQCKGNPTVPIDWNDYKNVVSKPADPQ